MKIIFSSNEFAKWFLLEEEYRDNYYKKVKYFGFFWILYNWPPQPTTVMLIVLLLVDAVGLYLTATNDWAHWGLVATYLMLTGLCMFGYIKSNKTKKTL